MKIGLVLMSLCAMLSLASCTKERIKGNGSVITETRNITGFTAISASGSTNVFVTQGTAFNVEVKGYANLLPYYETKLVNNKLQVGYRDNVTVKNDNTEVYITLPSLDGLQLAGSGNIRTSGIFTGITNFTTTIAGSGNIYFSTGSTQNFTSRIDGSGNIYALGFIAANVDTEITGSGNTEITANSRLKVKITGSGNVYYRGTPTITTNITGSGAVIPR